MFKWRKRQSHENQISYGESAPSVAFVDASFGNVLWWPNKYLKKPLQGLSWSSWSSLDRGPRNVQEKTMEAFRRTVVDGPDNLQIFNTKMIRPGRERTHGARNGTSIAATECWWDVEMKRSMGSLQLYGHQQLPQKVTEKVHSWWRYTRRRYPRMLTSDARMRPKLSSLLINKCLLYCQDHEAAVADGEHFTHFWIFNLEYKI